MCAEKRTGGGARVLGRLFMAALFKVMNPRKGTDFTIERERPRKSGEIRTMENQDVFYKALTICLIGTEFCPCTG